ncbi:MAG: hypothetical protein EOP52_10780 [Sphingobacteriales bacterium]|nr:MAG: hypothetical protein EOP52_10780 [Sphingobacteriales bacterium]
MKHLKHGLLAMAAVLGVSSTLLVASCEKDSCTSLNCKNGGTCADNFCRCPTGYEGAECEIKTSTKFLGVWPGSSRCNIVNDRDSLAPTLLDTLTVFMKTEPNRLGIVRYRAPFDTSYGTVKDDVLMFEDSTNGKYRRYQTLMLRPESITLLVVTTSDIDNPNTQTNCRFIGYTANKKK